MFVVLSPIFVTDTKIIYDYNFVAPLSKEVKQVLQRRGGGTGVTMELQRKTQWTNSKNLM